MNGPGIQSEMVCNKCGRSCAVWASRDPSWNCNYGRTIEFSSGYASYAYVDCHKITFNMCEGCLVDLCKTLTILPEVSDYFSGEMGLNFFDFVRNDYVHPSDGGPGGQPLPYTPEEFGFGEGVSEGARDPYLYGYEKDSLEWNNFLIGYDEGVAYAKSEGEILDELAATLFDLT